MEYIITKELDKLNLTGLENLFMTSFVNNLFAEKHFSDVTVREVAANIGKSIKIVRGVVGSLIKKGLIDVDGVDGVKKMSIVYLKEEYFNLHNNWKS